MNANDSSVSRRDFLKVAGVFGASSIAGCYTEGGGGDGMLPGGGGGGDIEASEIEEVYVAEAVADLGAPSVLPAMVVTLDAGVLYASEDATFESGTTNNMSQPAEFHIAQSVADLDEPDEYPAVAITLDDGLVIDMGGGS